MHMSLDTHISQFLDALSDAPRSAQPPSRASAPTMTASKPYCLQRFSGEIDMRNTIDFAAALDRILVEPHDRIVIDMTCVDFAGTSALTVLTQFCAAATESSTRVVVACGRAVARPIEACGLGPIETYDSVDAAIRAISTP